MKKLSVVMAFVFAIMFSSTALAANWIVVDNDKSGEAVEITTSVDKDSIKRGIKSAQYDFSRNDGFSAIVNIKISGKDIDDVKLIYLVGFYEENGVRKYCFLESFDDKGKMQPKEFTKIESYNVDSDGDVWPLVWDFIKKNLK